nr:disease resistance protein RGA5-like [Lolium perenne]
MQLAAGAMRPLLTKLGKLLLDEYYLDTKVKKGVSWKSTQPRTGRSSRSEGAGLGRSGGHADRSGAPADRKERAEPGCPDEFEQVSRGILKKYGGVPLAIITIASLLASNQNIKTKDQWCVLLNSIGRGLAEGDSIDEMQRILSLSYYDLPSRLKTCFLYLSIFPEDYQISRNRLIWRWIAEGFVQPDKHGTRMFELGEGYFTELINRCLIQPVNIDSERRAKDCHVHDMLLDLILSLSNEANFVTILDGTQRSTPNPQRKMRRLSLQNGMEDTSAPQLATASMSRVRSVALFQHAICVMPPLWKFEVLRVLDLEGCDMPESWYTINLKYIGNLLHLRYLRLNDSYIRELPVEIGKLQYLLVLDLLGSGIVQLPSSVILLTYLLNLRINFYTKMPFEIGKLLSLEELSTPWVDSNIAKELGHLTELRMLQIVWEGRETDGSLEKVIVESLGHLRKLQTLLIVDAYSGQGVIMLDGWVPAPQLRSFSSGVMFLRLPTWVNSSSVPLLSSLHIDVGELKQRDIQVIGRLPVLRDLWLTAKGDAGIEFLPEETFVVSADSFPCIKECKFYGLQILPSMFPRGAMPMVQSLRFTVRLSYMVDAEWDFDMKNLPSLEQVDVDFSCNGGCPEAAKEPEAALWQFAADTMRRLTADALRFAADEHPNRPYLLIH